MKYFLSILLLLPIYLQAQDCVLKNEKDQFNQDPRLTTGFKSIRAGSDKFLFSVSADKTEVDLFFAMENTGLCFGDLSRAMVVFEGGKSKGTYRHGGTVNCKGYFHFIFKNQENVPAPLTNLTVKKILSIQFTADDNKTKKIITLRPEDQDQIITMINCVVKELTTLRVNTWKPKQ